MEQNPVLYRHCIDWDSYIHQNHKQIRQFMDKTPSLYRKSINWSIHLRQHQTEIVSYTGRKYPHISNCPDTFCRPDYDWKKGAFDYFCQNRYKHALPLLHKEDYYRILGIDYDSFDSKQYALNTGKSTKTPKYSLLCSASQEKHEYSSQMCAYTNIKQQKTIPSPTPNFSSSRMSFLGTLENKLGNEESIILED